MKTALKLFILYRLPLGIILLVGAIILFAIGEWGTGIFLTLLSIICIVMYFMFGTMRLVQESMMAEDIDGALAYLSQIKYPNLLFKPIRQGYYLFQSQFAMASQDFDKAEDNIRQGLKAKSDMTKDYEGSSYLQLGLIAAQKGNKKEAKDHVTKALELGLPDSDSKAMAYLQLAAMEIQAKRTRQGVALFQKAKACKPQSPELKKQIADMDKYVAKIPRG